MNFFKRKQSPKKAAAQAVQTGRGAGDIFYKTQLCTPLATSEQRMYDALRASVPIIDAAIGKIVRLSSGFTVKCKNAAAQSAMDDFLLNIKVGPSGHGIDAFVSQYLDRLLTWGTAVAEIVPYTSGDIAAIYCADNEDLELLCGDDPLNVTVCTNFNGKIEPVKNQERLLFSALNPMPGSVQGTSILRGLPFVSSVLLKIYDTIGTNWERVGNLRYAVTYKPSGDAVEAALGSDTVGEISSEWAKAMNSTDGVRDFVAVGDVSVKVIGADNQILDSNVPVRQMLEQIVAKLGIPPFMLGLSWSSTERMSQQQADILTSELESYRAVLTPVLQRICVWQCRALGFAEVPQIEWNDINMQDEVEQARAKLYYAQAEQFTKGQSI